MPSFERCPKEIDQMALALMQGLGEHAPLLEHGLKIDFLFARATIDEKTGEKTGPALTCHGVSALGVTRKTTLKERVKGMADAEILLDGDWWETAPEEQRRALLDHELFHREIKTKDGELVTDDLGRPCLKLRKHDYQFGWFRKIAAHHGNASMEAIQAAQILDESGQYFWPQIVTPVLVGFKRGKGMVAA